MAEIAPLKGIIYNTSKTGNLRDLVAPPYDVVSPEEQASFHQAHANNVMHLTLGATHPDDQDPYDWHQRAAAKFSQWLEEKILIRHEQPAIYYTEMDFTNPITGQRKTRHGFVSLLKLENFDEKARVRPHESTFSSTRAERLNLMLNVNANLSQIFAVYPDEKGESQKILRSDIQSQPLFDFMDPSGRGHRIWPITDQAAIKKLSNFMLDKTVYIADGHHRYETSLNYRRTKLEEGVEIGPRSPLNYTMVYLCAISDPGLTILPAHRLISNTLHLSKKELETALERFFSVQTFSFTRVDERTTRRAFLRQLEKEGRTGNALGLYTHLGKTYYLLKPRNDVGQGTFLETWAPELRKLDTVVLTGLVLQEILGLTEKGLDDPNRITYTSRAGDAIRRVNEGLIQMACILNPTRINQVQDVAESGLIMPRKSTYFFPKVSTGLIFNRIDPAEEIDSVL
ncbi:MAG: DUF1015 domain-containing protein [Deltaproteobacteria bacterium]|nr:DUF1015 domain-containing protein [Deltaproteobacteria bacterium]MBW2051345.1 DUF1015 domain-containing protein [Deltaproteobacteria bacterium]MBW2139708.1 DUF1015 domain-containing protein [Deltaproteobacteria bacterium]MBW2321953.1 DUF1015 domain-containing protein [Deltaproteobacteria bacterium]